MLKKYLVISLKKLELFSALSMRLVQLTGKHKERIHPKHLIKEKLWYTKYLNRSDVVLDVGCGTGFALLQISKRIRKGVGLEADSKLTLLAKSEAKTRKTVNITFITGDANKKLPFTDSSFSKVICSDVLEHLERRTFALQEIKRVVKNRGYLLLVTDNPNTSWKKLQKSTGLFYYADQDHKYEYPENEIVKLLKNGGFKINSFKPVTYDTPLTGVLDLIGGISLSTYQKLRKWRQSMVIKYPQETTGYRIVAQKL